MMNLPSQMMVVALAGWDNEQQLAVTEYLKEENPVLREQLGRKRLRFTDDQRRRLAAKGKVLGHRVLGERSRSTWCTITSSERTKDWTTG